jgi:hypothetical protein
MYSLTMDYGGMEFGTTYESLDSLKEELKRRVDAIDESEVYESGEIKIQITIYESK